MIGTRTGRGISRNGSVLVRGFSHSVARTDSFITRTLDSVTMSSLRGNQRMERFRGMILGTPCYGYVGLRVIEGYQEGVNQRKESRSKLGISEPSEGVSSPGA